MRCRRLPVTTVIALAVVVVHAAAGPSGLVGKAARRDAIARAAVWTPTNVAAMDVRAGPAVPGAFAPDELVTCTYTPHARRGRTPKFHCMLPDGDVVKVKYGVSNGEVYAGVLATRLLWALGFGADRVYPVKIVCRGCPEDPMKDHKEVDGTREFSAAVVERKLPGDPIELNNDSGWKWVELNFVDQTSGGAPLAHRDALKLLAAMIQHTDNKPIQQRLNCDPGGLTDDGRCTKPFLIVHDVGLTFGHANYFNINNTGSVSFDLWKAEPVWHDKAACVGNLVKAATGTLGNPKISEAGRAFLAGLLDQLSDTQLHDLFEIGHVERRSRRPGTDEPPASVAEWVQAFKDKRAEIDMTRCPN